MKDVAARAGVGLKTVSRVVNGEAGVTPDTVRRVREAIEALGFRRNDSARILRKGRTASIGLVLEDLADPFYGPLSRAVEEAARAHGARTLLDATQSAGWLPLRAADYDYTVTGAFKWLLSPRGVSFLTVPAVCDELWPLYAGWAAGEVPWESYYGVERLAPSAHRFDESPATLPYLAAQHSLAVIEETGPAAIGAHDLALADRFRDGLAVLGHEPVASPGSAIVAVPGLGHAEDALTRAGVHVSVRAGNLRAAFHLYNTAADVDRLLDVLSTLPVRV
ncbi:MAG TPA: aminotransferase [Streptomyces sp.]|nr:aminotransferase [Streptomyces sp.]